jgi:hypothetical protein
MPLYVKTDFKWNINDKEKFNKLANFTFRYTSPNDPKRVVYAKARMETMPLGSGSTNNNSYSYLKSDTPLWPLTELVNLEYSVNG